MIDAQNMINKQHHKYPLTSSPFLTQSILLYKYSNQPRMNYDYRKFGQFISQKEKGERMTQLQIQCREFLAKYSHQQYLTTYNKFDKILERIQVLIMSRVKLNYLFPIHFKNQKFMNDIQRFKHNQYMQMFDSFQKKSTIKTNEQQNLKLKSSLQPLTTIPEITEKPTPNEKQIPSKISQQSSNHSTLFLEKVTKELSIIIKKLNEQQLQGNLTEYLYQLQNQFKFLTQSFPKKKLNLKRKQEKIKSKRSQKKEMEASQKLIRQQLDNQTYGLHKKRKKSERKMKKRSSMINCKTETVRKKIKEKQIAMKISPQTPKPYYRQKCLIIREFSPSQKYGSLDKKTKIKKKQKSRGKEYFQNMQKLPKSNMKKKDKNLKSKSKHCMIKTMHVD